MHPWPVVVWRKRPCCHRRTKIGSPDADIHHIGDRPTLPGERLIAHFLRERLHPRHCIQHLWHHIEAIDVDRTTVQIAQGRMQNRAAFGFVDRSTIEHRFAFLSDLGGVK